MVPASFLLGGLRLITAELRLHSSLSSDHPRCTVGKAGGFQSPCLTPAHSSPGAFQKFRYPAALLTHLQSEELAVGAQRVFWHALQELLVKLQCECRPPSSLTGLLCSLAEFSPCLLQWPWESLISCNLELPPGVRLAFLWDWSFSLVKSLLADSLF